MSEPDELLGEVVSPRIADLKSKLEYDKVKTFHRASKFSGTKITTLTMKVSEELRDSIRAEASKIGISVSDWCRKILEKAIGMSVQEKVAQKQAKPFWAMTPSEREAMDVLKRIPPLPTPKVMKGKKD